MRTLRGGKAFTPSLADDGRSIADIFEDTQYRARRNIQMKGSRAGAIAVPDVVPQLSSTPGEIRWLGEASARRTRKFFAISSASMTTTSSRCATKA
jgi:hypothetical protein